MAQAVDSDAKNLRHNGWRELVQGVKQNSNAARLFIRQGRILSLSHSVLTGDATLVSVVTTQ